VTEAPVFRGRIEQCGAGSVIIGRITPHRFVQLFLACWCGSLLIISLIFIWTLIAPIIAWGLLWLSNGMSAIESESVDDWANNIITHLREVAGG
jgi:hypothetical protein